MSYGINKSEKNHIWEKIAEITKIQDTQSGKLLALESKIPETIAESTQASKKTSEYRNRAQSSLKTTEESEKIVEELRESILSVSNNIESINEQISTIFEDVKSNSEAVTSFYDTLESVKNRSQPLLEEIEELTNQKSTLEGSINEISELSEQVANTEKKSRVLLAEMASSKKAIREIYDIVFGYNAENPENELEDAIKVEGLKDKLEKSYVQLESELNELSKSFSSQKEESRETFDRLNIEASEKYDSYISNCEDTYSGTVEKLKSLLPEALTAGLASAYEKKTKTENTELGEHKSTFKRSIFGLVVISIIPFAINITRLMQDKELEILSMIKDMPYLVFAMMPLYIPVLWIAYSANKSYKLSKRLIEEYSHKGVVSRTFEGLANQINELDNSELSVELRTQLLFNLITVNSENPGKLISDYNKSDHPLMDALDKSSQTASSLAKLAKIPGFSKLAKRLSDTGERILDIEDKKISEVLNDTSPIETGRSKP